MISAFGIEHGEFSKAAYYRAPSLSRTAASVQRGLKAPKRRVKKKPVPEPNRKDYVAADGVQVRWRGGA